MNEIRIQVSTPEESNRYERSSNNFFSNPKWAFAGTLCGIISGSLYNISRTHSLFKRDYTSCFLEPFNGNVLLEKINWWREKDFLSFRDNGAVVTMGTHLPLVYLVPLFGFAISNIITDVRTSGCKAKALAKLSFKHLTANVLTPLGYHIACGLVGMHIKRNIVYPLDSGSNLDTSGHVIMQMATCILAMKALSGLKQSGSAWQQKSFSLLNLAFSVTDMVWMFNCASHCHTVAGVMAGVFSASLPLASIELMKMSVKSCWERIQHLAFHNYSEKRS